MSKDDKKDEGAVESPAPKQSQKVTPKEPEYRVAEGVHIVCIRGVLEPGTIVTASDFTDGQKGIDELAARDPAVLVKA
jgi:hypothetical protein